MSNGITTTQRGFHTSLYPDVARQYGEYVLCFEFETLPQAKCNTIDKTGDFYSDIESGLEYVFNAAEHVTSFYQLLEDQYIL
jgi:hypothetical protein